MGLSCEAQPTEQLKSMNPEQLEEFRETYLDQFDRIGINTTPEDARMLKILVQSTGAKRAVEIGSANGYGAIHIGMGLEKNVGQLYTIDIDSEMVGKCRDNIKRTGLQEVVTCLEGDALKMIPELEGQFDFVFIDAQKSDYYAYFKAIEPKLTDNAMIVADNVIRFQSSMRNFLNDMRESDEYEMVIIQASQEKNDGMAIIYRNK